MVNGLSTLLLQSYISYCGEGAYQIKSANENNLRKFYTRKNISSHRYFLLLINNGYS